MVVISSKRTNSCLLCPENFTDPSGLDFHTKTVHLGVYICTRCPKFTTLIKMRFIQHNRKVHNETESKAGDKRSAVKASIDKEPCNISPKLTKIFSEEEGRFECEECWFTCTTKAELTVHTKSKHFNQQDVVGVHSSQIAQNYLSDSRNQATESPKGQSGSINQSAAFARKSRRSKPCPESQAVSENKTPEVLTDFESSVMTSSMEPTDMCASISIEKESAETVQEIRNILSSYSSNKNTLLSAEILTSEIDNLLSTYTSNDPSIKEATVTVEDANKTVEDADKTVEDADKTVEDADKTVEDFTKTFADSTKTVEDSTKTVEDFTKTVEDSTKSVEDSTKTVEDSTKTVEDSTKNVKVSSTDEIITNPIDIATSSVAAESVTSNSSDSETIADLSELINVGTKPISSLANVSTSEVLDCEGTELAEIEAIVKPIEDIAVKPETKLEATAMTVDYKATVKSESLASSETATEAVF